MALYYGDARCRRSGFQSRFTLRTYDELGRYWDYFEFDLCCSVHSLGWDYDNYSVRGCYECACPSPSRVIPIVAPIKPESYDNFDSISGRFHCRNHRIVDCVDCMLKVTSLDTQQKRMRMRRAFGVLALCTALKTCAPHGKLYHRAAQHFKAISASVLTSKGLSAGDNDSRSSSALNSN